MSETRTAPAPAVGDIVIEPTTGRRYAIGTGGFLDLSVGSFVTYDSAFPGPSFFDRPEFVIETPAEQPKMVEGAAEALDHLHYRYTRWVEANGPLTRADALVALNNAVSDMISWHPEYQYEFEGSYMPWQRNIED